MWSRMQWKNFIFLHLKWSIFYEKCEKRLHFKRLRPEASFFCMVQLEYLFLKLLLPASNPPLFMTTLEKWTPIESAMAFWMITLLFHELNEQKYLNKYKCVLQGLHFLELIHDCLDLQSIPVSEKKNINDIHIPLPPPCWKDELRLNPWIITSFPLAPSTNENKYLNRNQECT